MSDSHEDSERGMTPVIGIVMLVTITLLLAATVAAFALGIEDDQRPDRVPTIAVGFEYESNAGSDDMLSIVHKSGDSIAAESLAIDIDGATCAGDNPNGRYLAATWVSGDLTAGQAIHVDGDDICSGGSNLDLSGASVQIVWISDSGSSTLLRSWHGPS